MSWDTPSPPTRVSSSSSDPTDPLDPCSPDYIGPFFPDPAWHTIPPPDVLEARKNSKGVQDYLGSSYVGELGCFVFHFHFEAMIGGKWPEYQVIHRRTGETEVIWFKDLYTSSGPGNMFNLI